MNIQNKLYTGQLSCHLMTNSQPVPDRNRATHGFSEYHKTPKKDQTPRKVQTLGQERI